MLGLILAVLSGLPFCFGLPDHILETEMGPKHVSARPPGNPYYGVGMWSGLGMAAIGGVVYVGMGIKLQSSNKRNRGQCP